MPNDRSWIGILLWAAVLLGGLVLVGEWNKACLTDGSTGTTCGRGLELLGWIVTLVGLVMLARTLSKAPFVKRWFGD